MGHRWIPSCVAAALLVLAASALLPDSSLSAQSSSEVLRGRINSASESGPVDGAVVTITGLATRTVQTTRSDTRGAWTALFQYGEGDYVVQIRAIGFQPISFRVTRTGVSSVLQADVLMTPMIHELDTLTVTSQRSGADLVGARSIGGLETDALAAAIFLLDPSDLMALVMQTPGVFTTDSGFSVLGAGADQNSATLDGMNFGGGSLPQDAMASTSLVVSSADPSRGGFAGGMTATTLRGGTDIFNANIRLNGTDPHLAWSDPTWPQPVSTNITASGSIGGPIRKGKLFYLGSWSANTSRSDVYTLLDPQSQILIQSGITTDSVAALRGVLSNLSVPISNRSIPSLRTSDRISGSLTTDWRPTAQASVRANFNGNFSRSEGMGLSAQSFPSSATESSNSFFFGSVRASGLAFGLLNELSVSFNGSSYNSSPYLDLPSGSVRIGTVFEDGRTGLGSLRFGGSSGGSSRSSDGRIDAQHEVSILPANGNHKVKVGASYGYEWGTSFSAGNPWGSYSWQSLDDLASGSPSTFSRVMSVSERDTRGASSAFWLGDEWRVSPSLQMQLGLRLDAAHPSLVPQYNPVIDDVFGLRTDVVPRTVGLVPRLGFSWVSKARQNRNSPGGSPQIQLPPGMSIADLPPELIQMAMGGMPADAPGYVLSGSIGGYRGTVPTSRIASMIDATGLPNTRSVLSCVGAAVPSPIWDGSAPATTCLDGTAPETFSVNQPAVQVFDPSYSPSVSWRGTLQLDGLKPLGWRLRLNGAASMGTSIESAIDENLSRLNGFSLASEGGRPVFVSPEAIVPGTGAIAPGASRIDDRFSTVNRAVSDLRNYTTQFTATLAPPRPLFRGKLNPTLTYVYTHSRSQQRGFGGGGGFGGGFGRVIVVESAAGGFGGSFGGFGGGGATTAGDPAQKEWVTGQQPSHQFVLTMGTRLWWFNLNVRANVLSGVSFTPTVAGDVNGDGLSNDRAFIFDPNSGSTDAVLAQQMNELLAGTTSGARECLMRQFGQIAGANSCRTPWQARLDLNLNFQPPRNIGFGERLRFTTNMMNASGAIVRLFGLEDTPLGRSAASTQPESRLLYVTGFDPVTRRYEYRVNQVFGEPIDFGSSRRRFPPFQIQVGAELKIGGPPTSPIARSMGLIPPSGRPPLTDEELEQRVMAIGRNPVPAILALRDSLELTGNQVAELDSISRSFTEEVETILDPVVQYAVDKGKKIKDSGLNPLLAKAQPQIAKLVQSTIAAARGVLTLDQQAKLPAAGPGARPGGAPMMAPSAAPMTMPVGGVTGGTVIIEQRRP